MVTLLVGDKETPFSVHMDMLCEASHFFKSAFMGAGKFAETVERSMKLPKDDSDTVDRMLQWVYFNKFSLDQEAVKTEDNAQITYTQLAALYVAADKYGIVRLKNDIIDILFKIQNRDDAVFPQDDVVIYIYNNTTAVSGLRRLIVAVYVWRVGYPWFIAPASHGYMRTLPDLALDLVAGMALRIQRPKENPFFKSSCSFHDIGHDNLGGDSGDSDGSSSDESSSGDETSSTE